MKNSSKGIIGAIIGCCVIIVIILIVGGYFAAKTIGDQASKIQEEIEETNKIVEHNNEGVEIRDSIVDKIIDLTAELTTDPDKSKVENAISAMDKEIDVFRKFIKDKSPSEELNDLHEQYLQDAEKISDIANSLIDNYDDITKYNELIGEYNDAVDTLDVTNEDIAAYISTITTLETDIEDFESEFDFDTSDFDFNL